MIPLAALAVFSGLSLNLLLQFALGTSGAAGIQKGRRGLPLFQLAVLFVSVLFLWVLIRFLFSPFWKSLSEYFLFFPFSALVCMGLERLKKKFFPAVETKRVFHDLTAYDGLVPASLLITLSLASGFADALVLSLFFALGNLAAMFILNEIGRKSTLEWAPRFIRGNPLILISMGLLSLISAVIAGICFRILEAL